MLSIVRGGPKILVTETNNLNAICDFFKEQLQGTVHNKDTAFALADDNSCIVFITNHMESIVHVSDLSAIFLLPINIEKTLSAIINYKKNHLITSLRIAPKMILMRFLGDINKTMHALADDYNGTIGNFDDLMESHSQGVVITFTTNNLNKPIYLSQIHKNHSIYLDSSYTETLKSLHKKSLKYLNAGIDNKDWYELAIKIYDSFGQYKLHYERLIYIIEHLELGLVLGESWGTDAATMFYTVGIYRVRLVTFYPPEFIKKILLALEYVDNGDRIVDLDLYYRRKKIHWTDLQTKDLKKKCDISKKYRNVLLSKLNEENKDLLFYYENEIISNTY